MLSSGQARSVRAPAPAVCALGLRTSVAGQVIDGEARRWGVTCPSSYRESLSGEDWKLVHRVLVVPHPPPLSRPSASGPYPG